MTDMHIGAVTPRRTRARKLAGTAPLPPASTNSEIVAATSRQVRAMGQPKTSARSPEPETIPAAKAKRGESVAYEAPHTTTCAPHSPPIATETPRRTRATRSPATTHVAPVSEPIQNEALSATKTVTLSPRSARTRATIQTDTAGESPVSKPIAVTETKRRGKGAAHPLATGEIAPPSQPIQIGTGNGSGDNGAAMNMDTVLPSPHVANIEAGARLGPDAIPAPPPSSTPSGGHDLDGHRNTSAAGDGGASPAPMAGISAPLHPSIPALIAMQRQRTFAIKSQQRVDRACESFIASSLGFGVDMEPAKRKELYARAAKIRRSVEKGASVWATTAPPAPPSKRSAKAIRQSDTNVTDDNAVADACSPIILASLMARSAWDAMRTGAEKEMRRLAEMLPVWKWSVGVKGFGALGVSIIAAEASGPRGDVGSYATKERLWKRLGLAVIEGSRQRRVTDAAAAEQHGYNPRRRSEIWTIADSMFRHQWAGTNEEAGTAPHPVGPYGAVYMRRKSHTEGREWTGGRRENDARRVMTKALIEDYWRVWRGLEPLAAMNTEAKP